MKERRDVHMAKQNFESAMRNPQRMSVTTNLGKAYEGYYCDPKLDRETLPEGWSAYDIRHDDDGCGFFCELKNGYVVVNNCGTFFLKGKIEELNELGSSVYFKISSEEWHSAHLDGEPENGDDDWDYSFE